MKVELLRYTPDGEKLVAAAAKLCYSPVGIDEIEEGLSEDKVASFLKNLMDLGHESPIEHISFTFGVEGVSRALTHQLVRHRLASYSQKSQRYVTENNFKYVVPPAMEKLGLISDYERIMESLQEEYAGLVDSLKMMHMREYLKQYQEEDYKALTEVMDKVEGDFKDEMDKYMEKYKHKVKEIEKIAAEDARYILPNATETKIVVTMNARSLLHFFSVRCCNRAQWEIREMATEMLRQVKQVYPILFSHAGPSCANGPCPEGIMTCGKITEVREFYKGL